MQIYLICLSSSFFWCLSLLKVGCKETPNIETISDLNLVRNVGAAIVGITAPTDPKFPSRIPRRANSPHLRHCVSSNVAWTPRWDSKVLGMIGNQNMRYECVRSTEPTLVSHIRDHHHWSSMIIVIQTMSKISRLGKIGLPSFASVSRVIPVTPVISCPRRPVQKFELTGFQDF